MRITLTLILLIIMGTANLSAQCNSCCGENSNQETSCAAKRMLLIVDAQYDFINGSLAVSGAPAIMDSLAAYIGAQKPGTYTRIVMTADWHPQNHSSFKDHGGIWPAHCVQKTHGAEIYAPIHDAVKKLDEKAPVLTKGDDVKVDEYSIMANKPSAAQLIKMIDTLGITEIDVAGLCGDYCVGNTIKDLVKAGHGQKIRVMKQFIGNIDDGTVLDGIIRDNNLKVGSTE